MADRSRPSSGNTPAATTPTPPPDPSPSPPGVSHSSRRYPHPPDAVNPDAVTLRDQWRYATRQYSRWYSSAWGTAILAGTAFFALGWFIKGGNPLPSKAKELEEEEGRGPAAGSVVSHTK